MTVLVKGNIKPREGPLMMWADGQVSYLHADVSHFLCCTRAKEIGDVCTQATDILEPGQKCSNATTGYSYKRSNRVLSWIYRLNEKSRLAEDYEFPRGLWGHASPELL